jgi:hypothetical protein
MSVGKLVTRYETFGGNFYRYDIDIRKLGTVASSGTLVPPARLHVSIDEMDKIHTVTATNTSSLTNYVIHKFSMPMFSKPLGHETGYELFTVL